MIVPSLGNDPLDISSEDVPVSNEWSLVTRPLGQARLDPLSTSGLAGGRLRVFPTDATDSCCANPSGGCEHSLIVPGGNRRMMITALIEVLSGTNCIICPSFSPLTPFRAPFGGFRPPKLPEDLLRDDLT